MNYLPFSTNEIAASLHSAASLRPAVESECHPKINSTLIKENKTIRGFGTNLKGEVLAYGLTPFGCWLRQLQERINTMSKWTELSVATFFRVSPNCLRVRHIVDNGISRSCCA